MNEEQLLAQSEQDYMNDSQLDFFKSRLLALAEQSRERIASNRQLCQIERQADVADSASTEEDRSRAMRMIENDNARLKSIREALAAIDDKSYGYCTLTGEPIGLKRLLIVPDSLMSVHAMQVAEAQRKHQRAA